MSDSPRDCREFHFVAHRYDPATGAAELVYRADDGPELVERIRFPHSPWPPEPSRQAAFSAALHVLHLVAGVSYWKAGLAPVMCLATPLDPDLAEFMTDLYRQGLAEFAHVNRLTLAGRICFPTEAANGGSPQPLPLAERALVAVGGGKDSLVGLELARSTGLEVQPACIGASPLIANTVAAAGLPLLRIERVLAPELKAMNAAGAWNGHVPITAINSAILTCAAILYGYRHVIFSNERSADEATLVTADGTPVNHQYSKSGEFERHWRGVVAGHISPDLEYFSILRPFSELDVVRRFSTLTAFHKVYSSCNRNFHLDGPRIDSRWCGDCPKCRFAALSLAVFLQPPAICAIQGRDLLDDPGQLDGFRALCALGRGKPFECVGETGECRAALAAVAGNEAWKDRAVIAMLAPELGDVEVPRIEKLLTPAGRHYIPAPLAASLGLRPRA